MNGGMHLTTDNSSYTSIASMQDGCNNEAANAICSSLVDVTDTSNVKVRFSVGSIGGGSSWAGSTTQNTITMTFIRLGDT